jgi:SAM-dependent methyltransferase
MASQVHRSETDRDRPDPAELSFEDFRRMATDASLSPDEKIGFRDASRAGAEEAILADIVSKLPALAGRGARVLDIGPGCGALARLLLDLMGAHGHETFLVDSAEMLAQLPAPPHVTRVPGAFPEARPDGAFDAILAYSVLQYVHAEADVSAFVEAAVALLAPGGSLLIGDVPNASKRARFLSSAAGRAFHRRHMRTDEPPPDAVLHPPPGSLDDGVVLGLLADARAAGCDAYVVPLAAGLPLANRREDILVVRP